KMESKRKRAPRGYASYVTVLTLGIIVLVMLLNSYRTSIRAHAAQKEVTLRIDYDSKEEATLRAIVPIAANRAMRCMQHQSAAGNNDYELRWQRIFRAAIDESNSAYAVESAVLREFGLQDAVDANPGDKQLYASETFRAYDRDNRYTTPGINQDFGLGFPVPLESVSSQVNDLDHTWPIISDKKHYGSLAAEKVGASVEDYPQFNLIPYPEIRFGYAEPGEMFVAKRNWWAFKMNLSEHHDNITKLRKRTREFVFSIYEVPSQLGISAEAFTVLGQYEDGTEWQNFTIQGGVFASRARIGSGLNLDRISGRHGLEIDANATFGDEAAPGTIESGSDGGLTANPFAPGVRESYELENGDFLPVSLASESGRAAFIPINRGVEFFDRFAHNQETQTVSPTTWNNYSVGALQCAMHLDITDVKDADDPYPSELEFSFLKNGLRQTVEIGLEEGNDIGLPPGYIYIADENETVFFEQPVDVAYGKNGSYYFEEEVVGSVTFENARFGDPLVGTFKAGYYRPSYPFEVKMLHDAKPCIEVYPERFPDFLAQLGADSVEVNHSLSINVDYPGSAYLQKPSIPCTELDYGVILKECGDLTPYPKGFSLVTNLRLYIADDFNVAETTPPAGSGIPTPYYPPCSLFAPEKRYGAEDIPFRLKLGGQMGSLAGGADTGTESVHLFDLKTAMEGDVAHDKIEVNLSPIKHPAALPPISMMNWLVVLEERRSEMYTGKAAAN
ncbi:hypothetical protein, partial [Haloferula helveola]